MLGDTDPQMSDPMRTADVLREIIAHNNDAKLTSAIVIAFYDRAPKYPFADYMPCADRLMMDRTDYQHLCREIVYSYH